MKQIKIEYQGKLQTFQTENDFNNFLKTNKLKIDIDGNIYEEENMGVIPAILDKWFQERVEMRKLEKKYAKENNNELYQFYNQRQLVQKIMLNSAYGVLGLPLFRFYDKDNAEAVTKSGVTIIQTAGKAINHYYRNILKDDGDYVIYTDTDSCFASALPIIQRTMPEVDLNNEKEMIEKTLEICAQVQNFVNRMFDVMAEKAFHLKKHEFEAKQEVVAKTSFWLAKKRYTQFIINKNGVACDELEIKGIDVVRTSFPIRFRKFMSEFLIDILKKADKSVIDKKIYEFEMSIADVPVIELAKNTSIKFISQDKANNYDPSNRVPFNFVKGTPAQVKAGLAYNDLLEFWELNKKYPKLFHGQKIKWVYLLENEYGINCIAMKADGTDPKEIMDFIEKYIDRYLMLNQELKSKLLDFYNVLHWTYPDQCTMSNPEMAFDCF